MLTPQQNRVIVRASAIYDIVSVAGFITPWTVAGTLACVLAIGARLGFTGARPAFDATHTLFVNLMGSAVFVWAMARLAFPTQAMGRFDAASRALFAAWEIWAVRHGAPPIILAFTVGEIIFGLAELLPVNSPSPCAMPRLPEAAEPINRSSFFASENLAAQHGDPEPPHQGAALRA